MMGMKRNVTAYYLQILKTRSRGIGDINQQRCAPSESTPACQRSTNQFFCTSCRSNPSHANIEHNTLCPSYRFSSSKRESPHVSHYHPNYATTPTSHSCPPVAQPPNRTMYNRSPSPAPTLNHSSPREDRPVRARPASWGHQHCMRPPFERDALHAMRSFHFKQRRRAQTTTGITVGPNPSCPSPLAKTMVLYRIASAAKCALHDKFSLSAKPISRRSVPSQRVR